MRAPLYLDDAAVRRLLRLEELLPAIRTALIDYSHGRVQQPARLVMELGEAGLYFVKPVLVQDLLVTKLLSLIPGNAERGLPALISTLLLLDPQSGQRLAVLEGEWLTALRTAAASAVAAEALTAPGAKVVALLGSGVLARSHALALRQLHAQRPIRELRIWSRDPGRRERCAEELGGRACASAAEAVRGADLVCTLTSATEPVLQGEWLLPGAFVAAVGAPRAQWRELDDAAMRNLVIADSRSAAASESGDVILSGARVSAEIGEVLAGRVRPPAPGTTVIFKSLGLAVEDAVAARLVYQAALPR